MPFKLRNLMLNRVDLCAAGSNPHADILLFKSAEEDDVPAPKKKAKAPAKKADTRSKSKQRGDEEEEEEEDDDAITKADDDEDDEELDADAADEEEEDDEEEPPTRKRKAAKKSTGKKPAKKTLKAKVDDEDDGDVDDSDDDIADDEDEEFDGVPDDVLKSLPKHVQAQVRRQEQVIQKLRKETKEATRLVLTEKSKRERLEFIEKAKQQIPNLPGTAEDKGELLQALHSGEPLDSTTVKSIVKLLKAGDAATKNLLMAEHGSRRPDPEEGSALEQLNDMRDELMEKDSKLSKQQAMEKACRMHPDLYAKYRTEKRRASRTDVN